MSFHKPLPTGAPIVAIPEPRRSVKNLMQATALVAGGIVDQDPARHAPNLANCFMISPADMLIAGTSTRRPLLLSEFGDLCTGVGMEGVIVRLGTDLIPERSSFDIKLRSQSRMLCGYRLWLAECGHPTGWLIPSAGEAVFLRFAEAGLEIVRDAPFDTPDDLDDGLARAMKFLSIAREGWF